MFKINYLSKNSHGTFFFWICAERASSILLQDIAEIIRILTCHFLYNNTLSNKDVNNSDSLTLSTFDSTQKLIAYTSF